MKVIIVDDKKKNKKNKGTEIEYRLNLFLEAFRNLTINQAIQNKTENYQGSLLPEKFANFIILDKNPLLFNPAKYNEIEVYATVLEGRIFLK